MIKKIQPELDMTIQVQKFAFSNKFEELCALNLTMSRELEETANKQIDAVIEAFQIVKMNYDAWRSEHNASIPSNERLYLTPFLRTVKGSRRNIYLVWVRLCNEGYLGKLNTEGTWVLREIKRNGKTHYNKQIFKSNLSSYTKGCLAYMMDAEHNMVSLREKAAIATSLFETSRKIKPKGFGLLLAKKNLQELSESEQEEFNKVEDEMLYLKTNFDPLSVPKKLTKIQFCNN